MTQPAISRRALAATSLLLLAACASPSVAAAPTLVQARRSGKRGAPMAYLIPGLTAPAAAWDSVRPALEAAHDVRTLQLAGMGGGAPAQALPPAPLDAYADAIAAQLAADGARNAALIGHSMGGTLALMVAARAPERVSRALVVDQVPFVAPYLSGGMAQTPEQARAFAEAAHARMTAGAWADWVASNKPALARQSNDASFLPQVEAWMAASDQTATAALMRDLVQRDLRPLLPQIRQPILVLMSYDPAIIPLPKEAYLAIAKAQYAGARNAEVRLVEGARHWIMHDQPAAFTQVARAFLAGG